MGFTLYPIGASPPSFHWSMPESYVVLARKYRPDCFADILGQHATLKVLKNAFAGERIPKAMIFTGIQGTGKTTLARILAKALQCQQNHPPQDTACQICDSCRTISQGRFPDVLEIDAASHNGVESIQELISNARMMPMYSQAKIYIIDETHMLSNPAFQALSMLLADLPDHLKFILCTTEIKKIPKSIISHCMQFHLNPVENEPLAEYLQEITSRENRKITPEASLTLAKAAQGSVRDALSILEAAISGSTDTITETRLQDVLCLPDRKQATDLFMLLCKGNTPQALKQYRNQVDDGTEPHTVLAHLAQICHDVAALKVSASLDLPQIQTLQILANALDAPTLIHFWKILESSLIGIQSFHQTVSYGEMTLVRMTHSSARTSPEEYLDRLDALPPREVEKDPKPKTSAKAEVSPEIQTILDAFPGTTVKTIH